MARSVQVPGAALNNADADPNDIAAEREAVLNAAAASDALQSGDIEGARAILDKATEVAAKPAGKAKKKKKNPAVDTSQLGPDIVDISVPNIRRDADTERYGPEMPYPAGTQLDKDKMPCSGAAEAHYVVGNMLDEKRGWLIGRAIPLRTGPALELEDE